MRIRFTNPWWVVVGAVTGLFVCNGPVLTFTFGVFLKPIMADMGAQRGTVSLVFQKHRHFRGSFSSATITRVTEFPSIGAGELPAVGLSAGAFAQRCHSRRRSVVGGDLCAPHWAARGCLLPAAGWSV